MLGALGVALLLLGAAGCHAGWDDERSYVPEADDRFARAYIDTLRAGAYERVEQRILPGIEHGAVLRDSLRAISRQLRGAPTSAMRLAASSVEHVGAMTGTSLLYEQRGDSGWNAVTAVVVEELGYRYLSSLHVEPLPRSFEEANAFTFHGKGAGHVFAFALLLACGGFALWTAVLAARTPMPRRWLWAIASLGGASRLAFDWTTGELHASLLTWGIPLIGAVREGPAAPWVLFLAFPLGAVLALERVHGWRRAQRERAAVQPPAAVAALGDAASAEAPPSEEPLP